MVSLSHVVLLVLLCGSLLLSGVESSNPGSGGASNGKAKAEKLQKFISWVGALNGAQIHGVAIRDLGMENGGLGLFAKDAISNNTTILKFPKTDMLHPGIGRRIEVLYNMFEAFTLGEVDQLALFLVYERFVNPESRWKEYIDILPTTFNHPLFYTASDLEELKGSPIYHQVTRRNEALAETFNAFTAEQSEVVSEAFPEGTLTFDNYRWAMAVVFSRLLVIALRNKSGDWGKYDCIVPLVDLLNTGYPDEINTFCRTSEDSNFVECVASRDIKPGEEVIKSYSVSGVSNAEYLMDYGIAFEENFKDTLVVAMPEFHVDNKNVKEEIAISLKNLMKHLGEETNGFKEIKLNWDKPVKENVALMSFLRLLSLTDEDLAQKASAIEKLSKHEAVSDESEREAHDKLIKHLESVEETYPTTLEEDKEILNTLYEENRPDQVNKKAAVIARLAEKSLLRTQIDILKEEKSLIGTSRREEGGYKTNPLWRKSEL